MFLYVADHLQIGRKTMNFKGIVLGALSFLIIGVWHPIVIKGEYHLGRKMCMPLFGAIGALCVAVSLRVKNTMLNTAIALLDSPRSGASMKWPNRKRALPEDGSQPIQNARTNNNLRQTRRGIVAFLVCVLSML